MTKVVLYFIKHTFHYLYLKLKRKNKELSFKNFKLFINNSL
jgi:hypothetical protein